MDRFGHQFVVAVVSFTQKMNMQAKCNYSFSSIKVRMPEGDFCRTVRLLPLHKRVYYVCVCGLWVVGLDTVCPCVMPSTKIFIFLQSSHDIGRGGWSWRMNEPDFYYCYWTADNSTRATFQLDV